MMRDISHKNIIHLIEVLKFKLLFYYQVYESSGKIYLVMELIRGGSLEKIKYNERDASVIMKSLLSALEYLHYKNIMHRDIKPENIMFKN